MVRVHSTAPNKRHPSGCLFLFPSAGPCLLDAPDGYIHTSPPRQKVYIDFSDRSSLRLMKFGKAHPAIRMAFTRLTACLLLSVFLLLSINSYAQHFPASQQEEIRQTAVERGYCPTTGCPCTDDHSTTGGCSSECSCCSFLAPLPSPLAYAFSPATSTTDRPEPYWILPQVYLSIFVPPQNRV